jgi:hypothetical protein
MAVSVQLSCVLALTGATLLSSWTLRDTLVALVAGGLLGLACVSVAVIHATASW